MKKRLFFIGRDTLAGSPRSCLRRTGGGGMGTVVRWFMRCLPLLCSQGRIRGQLLPVEVTNDSRDVRPRLVIRRRAAILLHATRSGAVGGEALRHIDIACPQQPAAA